MGNSVFQDIELMETEYFMKTVLFYHFQQITNMSLTLKEYLGKYHASRNSNTCKNATSISMFQQNDFDKSLGAKIMNIKKTIKKYLISKEIYQSIQKELEELKEFVLKNRNQFSSKISKKNSLIDTSSINLRSNDIQKDSQVYIYSNNCKSQNPNESNKSYLGDGVMKIKIKTEPNEQKAENNSKRFLKTMMQSSDSTIYETSSKFETSKGFSNQSSKKETGGKEPNKMMVPPNLQQSFINIQIGQEDSQIRKTNKVKIKYHFVE